MKRFKIQSLASLEEEMKAVVFLVTETLLTVRAHGRKEVYGSGFF